MIDWELISLYSHEQLFKIASKIAQKANRKIDKLGKSGIEASPAYKKLKTYAGAPYISEEKRAGKKYNEIRFEPEKTTSIGQLRELLAIADSFISAKTSSLAGIQEVNRNKKKTLLDKYGGFTSNKEVDSFLRFLGTPEAQAAMKRFDSEIVVTAIHRAHLRDRDRDLKSLWNDFEKSQKSFGDWILENEGYLEEEGFEF